MLEAPVPISSAKRTVSSTGADVEFCKRGMGDYSMIVHLFMHYLFIIIRLSVALGENSGWSTACRPDYSFDGNSDTERIINFELLMGITFPVKGISTKY